MSINIKSILPIGLLALSSSIFAGSMGENSLNYAGSWAGVGGGYINTFTNGHTDITMISTTISPQEYLLDKNLENHFAPVANAGYRFNLPNNWLIGVKGVYKYVGVEQFDQSWAGTFQNGTYQSAGLHTKINDVTFLTLDGGYQFGSWLVYGGAGPSLTRVSEQLNGDLLPPTSFVLQPVNISQSKLFLGGAGQVGFEYMLPNRFMIDFSYNLVVSGNSKMPNLYFQSGTANNYTLFSQQIQVVEQGINITINKFFM